MTPIPADLREALALLLGALEADLRMDAIEPVLVAGAIRATVEGRVLYVPASALSHWNRFHNIPTALVRDAAYGAKRQQLRRDGTHRPAAIEADSMAYAERFLRALNEME